MAPEFAEILLTVPVESRTGRVFPLPMERGETSRVDTVRKIIVEIGERAGVKVNNEIRKGRE